MVRICRRAGETDKMMSPTIVPTNVYTYITSVIRPQVLLVTGGYNEDYNILDSTEILRPFSGWQEITTARLPWPLRGARVTTLDNRVLLFGELDILSFIQPNSTILHTGVIGGRDSDHNRREDILELTDGDRWTKVGKLRQGRSYFGLGFIDYKMYTSYINKNRCK